MVTEHSTASAQHHASRFTNRQKNDRNKEKDFSVVPASCKQVEGQPQDPAAISLDRTIRSSVLDANTKNFANAFHAAVIYVWILCAVAFVLSFLFPSKMVYNVSGH